MKEYFNPLNNKWLIYTLAIVVIQQVLVAGGTFFLGELSKEYAISGFNVNIAILLFTCIFLPGTIVHYFVMLSTVKASRSAQLNYINEYIKKNYNHPKYWRHESSKQMRHDILCRSGQEAIQTSIYFITDSLATLLNIVLNTISIILVTDFLVGAIILSAGLAGILIIHLFRNKISNSSRNEILADNLLNGHLIRSWDNIILGNNVYFERWKTYFHELFGNSKEASLNVVKVKDFAVAIAGMVTNGIVLGGMLLLAWYYSAYPGFVLATLVMLPRSLQIVMHIQIIQNYLAKWKSIQEKLKVVKLSLEQFEQFDLNQFVQKDNIFINTKDKKISLDELEKILDNSKNGRITITGNNGSGKSSLLLNLKDKYKSRAIIIPAQHNLMLKKMQLSLSSGELSLQSLMDVKSSNEPIILLDEWDANLSCENMEQIDRIIEAISIDRVIIEVRHKLKNV